MSTKTKIHISEDSDDHSDQESEQDNETEDEDEETDVSEDETVDDHDLIIDDDEKAEDSEHESNNSENEQEEDQESEIDDEDLFEDLEGEDDELNNEDGEDTIEQEDTDLMLDEGDDGNVFEDKRKKPTKKKSIKKKLFPFIQKKKKKGITIPRPELEYEQENIDIRETTISLLDKFILNNQSKVSITSRQLERIVFNLTIRLIEDDIKKVDYEVDYSEDTNIFKNVYIEIVRHCIGYMITKPNELDLLVNELKSNIYHWKSKLYTFEYEQNKKELDKINNPALVSENPDYPCPKCKCIKAYTSTKQLRGGDEGESKIFTCAQCTFRWRING